MFEFDPLVVFHLSFGINKNPPLWWFKKFMLRIGITGGIGSGKSTIAKVFSTLGIPVYYADDAAKRLMNADAGLKQQIQKHFGADTYKNGVLDRAFLAGIVFNDQYKLELLNTLVHPVTIRDANEWIKQQQSPYVVKEAALLFETSAQEGLDLIIGVSAPKHLRLHRTMQRDKISKEEIKKRMERQVDENIKMKLCDFIIYNDEQHLVIPQVLALHQRFMQGNRN